jgi:hypothetical protein
MPELTPNQIKLMVKAKNKNKKNHSFRIVLRSSRIKQKPKHENKFFNKQKNETFEMI